MARHSDEGFSLSELLVVVGLIGIILGAAWAFFLVASRGSAQTEREAWLSREIGQPLEYAERIYMQQLDLKFKDAAGVIHDRRQWCLATTDRDHDDQLETYIFQTTADGRLTVTSSETSDSPSPRTATWSTSNRNRLTSPATPFFTYYDINGVDISTKPLDYIQQYAASMTLTIVAEYDGKLETGSRRIYFRNQ